MDIIPAIDIRNSRCVRLTQGKDETTKEYSDDPVIVAQTWVQQGARRLHVVNLDGAFGRESATLGILARIAADRGALIQYGGGLRSREAIEAAFAAGAAKVVLGTIAVVHEGLLGETVRDFGADRVIVALDAVEGRIAMRGWTEVTDRNVLEVARHLQAGGVTEVLYTDIHRDGMMTGPDLRTLGELADTGLSVIASGGIASEEDILDLLALEKATLTGAVIGKALYEEKVSLPSLLALKRQR